MSQMAPRLHIKQLWGGLFAISPSSGNFPSPKIIKKSEKTSTSISVNWNNFRSSIRKMDNRHVGATEGQSKASKTLNGKQT